MLQKADLNILDFSSKGHRCSYIYVINIQPVRKLSFDKIVVFL